MSSKINLTVPDRVLAAVKTLQGGGFSAYIVGGCVRDLVMGRQSSDWDLTTSALPEDIQKLFPHTVYENEYGTVGVVSDDEKDETLKIIEVTPYRGEEGYSDNRRPDKVSFGVSLEYDLSRRDFTINALAYDPVTKELVDNYNGIADLNNGFIRTVGDPDSRFSEDALRLMRAVRIATQLSGKIEDETLCAIKRNAKAIQQIAVERIREELVYILESEKPMVGILLLEQVGLLEHIIPELRRGIGIKQNQAHRFEVFEHNLRTLEHAGVKKLSLVLRLAALFHDISKPETREWSQEKSDYTFYLHEVVGARTARAIMRRLKFPKHFTDEVVLFVRWHMFFSDTEKVTLSGVRRMVARVGKEKIWDLINLRMCDRIGTGRPKEQPYRLRKYQSMVEEVLRDPVTPGRLTIRGEEVMTAIAEKPSKRIGQIIHSLLAEVLEDPTKNTKEYLLNRSKEMAKLDNDALAKLGEEGRIRRLQEDLEQVQKIRSRNKVT